jgi:phosphohistidine swiveling domain-containing protein
MHTGLNGVTSTLDRLTPDAAALAGGKAYNCARLKQAGLPVPDGLAVLSTATDADLRALGSHPWFDAQPAEATFAVRSSGIDEDGVGESFAGIHQTILEVRRADTLAAVAACRASGRSAAALEYRRTRGLATDAIAMGVLIQRMIQPVTAGVAFTINPVSGAASEIVINASWGVGEALVSGQIDPDELVVRKADGALLWSRIGEKTDGSARTLSLTAEQIEELTQLLVGIENHFGAPQDVEWCHDGARFWIVQSRPVTTGAGHADETEWTRANVAEVLPDLTSPQALSVFEALLNRAEQQYLGRLMAPEAELGPMVKSFHGRLCFNLSQMRRVCALSGVAPAAMLRSMGHAGAIQPIDEQPPRPSLAQLRRAPDFARLLWQHLRATRIIRDHDARTRRSLTRLTTVNPHRLSDGEVWAPIERWFAEAPDDMQVVLLLTNVMVHETPVRRACEKVGFSFEALVYPQLATGEKSVSAQQAFDLVTLAAAARREPAVARYLLGELSSLAHLRAALAGTAFVEKFERFLKTYGHRGRYEYDWSLPRYHEDPLPLLRALRAHLEGGAIDDAWSTVRRQEKEAAEAWRGFERRLSPWQRRTLLPGVRRAVRRIKQYYVWRERVRSDMARLLSELRRWHLVLADRFVERRLIDRRDDYFLLEFGEVASIVRGGLGADGCRTIVVARKAERERQASIAMPLLLRASELPTLIRMAGLSGGPLEVGDLTGQPVSGGCVEGEVVVVRDPADFAQMKRGVILVAPATDPSWTPLFTLASGVIVEVGGVLSHASTIAREYGLPALANVRQATRRLRTGERVRLDAVNGRVHRLAPPALREDVGTTSTPLIELTACARATAVR